MTWKRCLTLMTAAALLMFSAALFFTTVAARADTTFTVTSTGDTGAANELRWAINQANITAGRDTIDFTIAGAGPHTIALTSPLPSITESAVINGYSQAGSVPPGPGAPATIKIVINGAGAGGGDGLHIGPGANATDVSGLSIVNFNGDGIELDNVGGCQIFGNHIGVDAAGMADMGNASNGVYVGINCSGNTIGGIDDSRRNVISGNSADGVRVAGGSTNTISANYIGLAATGSLRIMNNSSGVYMLGNSTGTTVGGTTSGRRNIISGNNNCGVDAFSSSGNSIMGNYIGTDVSGAADIGNSQSGVIVRSGSNNNAIGGDSPGEGNVISGNNVYGVRVMGVTGTTISGNYIGLGQDGATLVGNGDGVRIESAATATTLGGDTGDERNVISGNADDGVEVDSCTGITVSGNYIGTDASGALDRGNTWDGISLTNANTNTIGGATPGTANVVSGNNDGGIDLDSSDGNNIWGNLIGTDAGGGEDVGNAQTGVGLFNGSDTNNVGGDTALERNVISANGGQGIDIEASINNVVSGNYIGVDALGTSDEGNDSDGVRVRSNSNGCTVGGDAPGTGNVISGNGADGVHVDSCSTVSVRGNTIGTDVAGALDVGNMNEGVHITGLLASGCTVGGLTPLERNVISGNDASGVFVEGAGGCSVIGNHIGTDLTGASALGNLYGVRIDGGASGTTVGGTSAGQRNVISGNTSNGVSIGVATTTALLGNYIGVGATGTAQLPNTMEGVSAAGCTGLEIGRGEAGAGNVISKNGRSGIDISGASTGVAIEGNYIGVDASGTLDRGNNMDGIRANSCASMTIGGPAAADRNIVSNNGMGGISLTGSTNATIQNNFIGTDVAGNPGFGNKGPGLTVAAGSDGAVIGGAATGNIISSNGETEGAVVLRDSADCQFEFNQVTGNLNAGVTVDGAAALRDELSRNSIFGNGSPGIQLLNGGNADYAAPAFSASTFAMVSGNVNVSGTAPASATVEIYYVGATADPSGSGQGLTWLATAMASAGGAFSATLTGLDYGDRISAIAISPASHPSGAGNTSGFAMNAEVVHAAPTVASIAPNAGFRGTTVNITNLSGSGFWGTPTVELVGPTAGSGRKAGATMTATSVSVVSSTKITCRIDLATAQTGSYSVKVTNQDNKSAIKAGAFTVDTSTPTWYLAEGTTAWGFETYISVVNPNSAPVTVDLTYMPTGEANKVQTITMTPNSRATISPKDLLGSKDFSTKVSCRQGLTIAADRTMQWTGQRAPAPECHASIGVTAPAKAWYLPEGSTDWGFETWLLIQNPNGTKADCQVTYMIEGEGPKTVPHEVAANSRASFDMSADIGNKDASIKVTSDQAVIPERAMYRNSRREGHDSIGTTSPADDYFLAEGTTAWGFTTYVLVQNPNNAATQVNVTYMTSDGAVPHHENPITMPANSRKTIRVNDYLASKDFSTKVSGSGPIIAERAMYWQSNGEACHDSIGMSEPHTIFYLPDGQAGSDVETWTLVQNPNASAVAVNITYLDESGGAPKVISDTIPANSRKSYDMSAAGISGRHAVVVSSNTAGRKIMVERAMYWYARAAGTDTIGGFED